MDIPNNDQDKQTIEDLRKAAEDNLSGWKRTKADLINLQNDWARERAEWAKYACAGAIVRLLPAMDTLLAAAAHLPELGDTVKKFTDYLNGEGVTEIETVGKYDPAIHEVVSKEKKEGALSDEITVVVQRGYKLHDRILRAAKVIIAE